LPQAARALEGAAKSGCPIAAPEVGELEAPKRSQ
jgi:hypothetical protein